LGHDLIENILSLLKFLQEKGVPVDRSTEPEVRRLLPDVSGSRSVEQALQTAYEMICLMEEIPGGFLIYRADGDEEIVYANSGLLRIFRCDTWEQFLETTNRSFRGLVHPDDLDEVEQSIKKQIAESQYDLDYVEYRITRRDGTAAWIEDYGHFVHGDTVGDFFYVFLADATEKQARRLEEDLRREVWQKQLLATALENANLAIVAKNEFLSNMSHNMRTPLNAIFGFTALAKMECRDPEILSYLEQVDASGRQLLDLIEKVLNISWLSASEHLVEAECDLCRVVRDACATPQAQAGEKGLKFELDCSGVEHSMVWSDAEQLTKLVTYLAGNAVTYTGPGGRVSVHLTEGEDLPEDRRSYRLVVADTGVGMEPEFLGRLFEPFTREKNTTQSGVNGMGLGLTISKYIVDRMGGTIQAESVLGQGRVFTVSLPLKSLASAEPVRPQEREVRASGQRILLVEDNEFNREIETEILRNGGFLVDTAENGSVAVEKVKDSLHQGYDLILMDLQMPVMDGWTAAQEIRKLDDPRLSSIPIVALSANTLVRDMRRSMDCGMNAYLTKPIDVPQLLEQIRRTTGQHRAEQNK